MTNNKPTIGDTVDAIVKLDDQIERIEAKAKPLKEQRDALEAQLLEQFRAENTTQAKTKKATAFITKTTYADIEKDRWPDFFAWVVKNKAIDAIQRRCASRAIQDRLANKEKIPGVITGTRTSVTVKRNK